MRFYVAPPGAIWHKPPAMMLMAPTPTGTPVVPSDLPFADLPKVPVKRPPRPLSYSKLGPCEITPERGSLGGNIVTPTGPQLISHGETAADWECIQLAAIMAGVDISIATIANLNGCCRDAALEYSPSRDRWRMVAHRCGLRVCPTCAPRLADKLARRLAAWMGRIKQYEWRMFTFSMPSSRGDLVEAIDELWAAFTRFRREPAWCGTQLYGYAQLEVTYNVEKDWWHAHLHVLMRGHFIQCGEAHVAWKRSCRGPGNFNVVPVDSTRLAAKYVAKYVGKPCKLVKVDRDGRAHAIEGATLKDLPLERQVEWVRAVCNRRWSRKVGVGPAMPADVSPDDDAKGVNDWAWKGSVASFLRRAGEGEPSAIKALSDSLPGWGAGRAPPMD